MAKTVKGMPCTPAKVAKTPKNNPMRPDASINPSGKPVGGKGISPVMGKKTMPKMGRMGSPKGY
jgi:hypothetical protein